MTIRITEKRKRILNTLKKHKGIFSANDIHKKLSDIDLVTIYRNLDLFYKEGIILKVNLNSNETQYEYQSAPHYHAVCNKCKKVIHFDASRKKIEKILGLKDFKVREIDLVVRGECGHK